MDQDINDWIDRYNIKALITTKVSDIEEIEQTHLFVSVSSFIRNK